MKIFTISPQKTLQKGYTIISKGKKIVSSSNEVNTEDNIIIQFHDGIAKAKIE